MSTAQNMIDLNADDMRIGRESIAFEWIDSEECITRAEFADGSAMDKVNGEWIVEGDE
jgi:hypothetical protein